MHTGWGFAKKGTKILRHWGSKGIGHSEGGKATLCATNFRKYSQCHFEVLAEESFLQGAKLLRHYGTRVNLPLPTGEVDFVSERSEFTKSGEGTIFKMLNRAKKKCAFTLSEVLIVLAVLGVVAAMTIPDLIQDYREKALITALKKNYSIFSQALDMAVAENGVPSTWVLGSENSRTGALALYDILKPYLKIEKDCGREAGCFAEHYTVLGGGADTYWQPDTWHTYAKGILASGTSFHTYWNGDGAIDASGMIGVDVNGKAGPNKNGVDYFWFIILPNGVLEPYGKSYIRPAALNPVCLYNVSGNISNGFGCTWWALKHENMDYLRKAGKYVGY